MADKPNVPFHTARQPNDYPRRSTPAYGWRDDNGRPIHAIDENGAPTCGLRSSNTKLPCQNKVLCANGRCCLPAQEPKDFRPRAALDDRKGYSRAFKSTFLKGETKRAATLASWRLGVCSSPLRSH